jgi:hypothetical protein
MRYGLVIVTVAAFLIATGYALKAEWIRDHLLNWTAKTYGMTSTPFRMQKWFVNNSLYVTSFHIVAAIVAIALLGAIVYMIVAGEKSR